MKLHDRYDAGRQLAGPLRKFAGQDTVVLGLPRGGVVTAAEVALHLDAPLDIIAVRKISHAFAPEFAIGAVAEHGDALWSMEFLTPTGRQRQEERAEELQDIARRLRHTYMDGQNPVDLTGKVAVIVDDGIATGLTAAAAGIEARRRGAATVVIAAPVSPHEAHALLASYADELVILHEPVGEFSAVSQYYENFPQIEDEEVQELLTNYVQPSGKPMAEQAADVLGMDSLNLDLESLNEVASSVPVYPATSMELAEQARRLSAPASVVQFFETIPAGATFPSKSDVMERSYEVSLLEQQAETEPPERPQPDD